MLSVREECFILLWVICFEATAELIKFNLEAVSHVKQ